MLVCLCCIWLLVFAACVLHVLVAQAMILRRLCSSVLKLRICRGTNDLPDCGQSCYVTFFVCVKVGSAMSMFRYTKAYKKHFVWTYFYMFFLRVLLAHLAREDMRI